nr:hypothetical protein [Tanacetum cinerariifolium]
MSGVGKPMLMDKMTKERCLKKSGKLDFARVLVEVNAKEELPHVLEIAYPPIGNKPVKVGKTKDEVDASKLKEVLKGGGSVIDKGDNGNLNEYGFVKVGIKSMHLLLQCKPSQRNITNYGPNNQSIQSKGFQSYNKQVKCKSNANIVAGVKKSSSHKVCGGIMKPSVDLSNFNPKVLVRGSGFKSYGVVNALNEDVPVTNDFQALSDNKMAVEDDLEGKVDEECRKVVWPKLKAKVDEIMMSGTYPSMQVKTDWSLSQLDYFVKNFHKYGIDPYDDEEDVQT